MRALWHAARRATLILMAGFPVTASTVDTTPGWTGGGYILGAGPGYFGQVFTAPAGAELLNSVTFFVTGSSPSLSFRAEVARWNSTNFISGDPLYVSELRTNAGFPPYLGTVQSYGQVMFTIAGGLPVIPDTQYVAILSMEPGGAPAAIGNNFNVDAYLGGYHLFGGPPNGWYNVGDTHDYAFRASFSGEVPEPSQTELVLLGLGCLRIVVRFSRRASRSN